MQLIKMLFIEVVMNTIDTALAKRMVEAQAINGAAIVGTVDGWSVLLKFGNQEKQLGAQRSDRARMWRSLDRCVEYVKKELQITQFNLLDSTNFDELAAPGKKREDASERLKNAHEAAAHDKWFREQVEIGLAEADDLSTKWVSNEDAKSSWAKKRADLLKRAGSLA